MTRLSARSTLDEMRTYYYSVHDAERAEVIELLGSMKDPAATRELIQIYEECEWRNTRFQIIQALSRHPHQRGLEFLFTLSQAKNDIPVAEAAIWSLGQSHHKLAALFLTNLFPDCDELIRPAVVGALGQIPDRTLAKDFLAELPKAIREKKSGLVKSLILTLGELKVKEALPLFLDFLDQSIRKDLQWDEGLASQLNLCALVALGKIARDPKILDKYENHFGKDHFEYQLFTSVKAQVQFRSQWKLEDYLSRIFSDREIHPSLPYELNSFNPDDVKEGLKLFLADTHFERLCTVLGKIDFPDVSRWYMDLLDWKRLDAEDLLCVLQSISHHRDPAMMLPLLKVYNPSAEPGATANISLEGKDVGKIFSKWLEVVLMSLPETELEFKKALLPSGLSDEVKVASINQVYYLGLTSVRNSTRWKTVGALLESLLEKGFSIQVQTRILRALGELGFQSKKAKDYVKDKLEAWEKDSEDHSISSCLKYLQLCPEKSLIPLLLKGLEHCRKPSLAIHSKKWSTACLKALRQVPHLPTTPEIISYFGQCLQENDSEVRTIEILRLIEKHRISGLLKQVLPCLQKSEAIQLAALITIRAIGDENSSDLVAPLLHLKHESLSGRALDTLLSLPGMRAKRISIDFLIENAEDLDICDKIIRCLKPPEAPSDYFSKAIEGLLKRYPSHPLLDGLVLLREKVSQGSSQAKGLPKGVDIEAVDREISSKLQAYSLFEESVKSALRSAELPYLHREMFDEYVDKGSSVVEYCKAVDLLLESLLGKKLLFPKLENKLFEFQNIVHLAGLNEDYAVPQRVLTQTGLEKHFTLQSLPVHKMSLIARDIQTGKILRDYFRSLDGLRAWAIILLLFSRSIQGLKPLIELKSASEDALISFSKRLMALQDVRNPFAHRQTVVKFSSVDEVRNEAFSVLGLVSRIFG